MDSALNGHVTDIQLKNPHLYNMTVERETDGGRVVLKLKGTVRTYYQKQMAQESFRNEEGISEILNELEVLGRSVRLDNKESRFEG